MKTVLRASVLSFFVVSCGAANVPLQNGAANQSANQANAAATPSALEQSLIVACEALLSASSPTPAPTATPAATNTPAASTTPSTTDTSSTSATATATPTPGATTAAVSADVEAKCKSLAQQLAQSGATAATNVNDILSNLNWRSGPGGGGRQNSVGRHRDGNRPPMGQGWQQPTADQIAARAKARATRVIAALDKDGDSQLTLDEFLTPPAMDLSKLPDALKAKVQASLDQEKATLTTLFNKYATVKDTTKNVSTLSADELTKLYSDLMTSKS